jgi:pyrroline-5-carboxylate reductase
MSKSLAILGAGNMAEAIARAILDTKLFSAKDIVASDPTDARRTLFESELKIQTTTDNADAVKNAAIILLSVKPQQMADVLSRIAPYLQSKALIVSIAAGISTDFIERHLAMQSPPRIIRAMPNTPMLVGEGMVGLARGRHATADDLATARKLFDAAAKVIEVNEDQIDAVTAVSGSGPAYFFLLVENMIRAGMEMGLSQEHARQLATQTALGAATMLVRSEDSPEVLRQKVTSPGGTTHAAITHMESRDVPQAIVDALKAAQARGRELGQ